MTIIAEDLRTTSSHEIENRLPPSETDPPIHSNMHGLRQAQKIPPGKDNSAPREGAGTGETHEARPSYHS